MKWVHRRVSMIQKIVRLLVVFIALPAMLLSAHLYASSSQKLYEQALRDKQNAVQQLAANLQSYIGTLESMSRDMAYSAAVDKLLQRRNADLYPIWTEKYVEQVLLMLKYSTFHQNLGIDKVFLFTPNTSLPQNTSLRHDTLLAELPFFRSYSEKGDIYGLYLMEGEDALAYFAARGAKTAPANADLALFLCDIRSQIGGQRIGTLVFEISPKRLFQSVDAYGANGYAMLADTGQIYGAISVPELAGGEEPADGYLYVRLDRCNLIVGDTEAIDRSLYTSPALRVAVLIVAITVAQIVILAVFFRRTFGMLNSDLNQLDSIVVQGFSGRLPVARDDEIGQIGRRYNLLLDKIDSLVANIVEKETASKSAQLAALQYQINPHYIYNTLSIFSGSAENSGNYELSESISAFGHLLRYNLSAEGLYSTVAKEADNAINLTHVYVLKYHKGLELVMQIQPETRQCRVIRYLFQPIMENSILHGRRESGARLVVSVRVEYIGEFLMIAISDNGVGMPAGRLAQVRRDIARGDSANKQGAIHIGLRNVAERIALFYGNRASFEIDSRENKGTVVTMRIPTELPRGLPPGRGIAE